MSDTPAKIPFCTTCRRKGHLAGEICAMLRYPCPICGGFHQQEDDVTAVTEGAHPRAAASAVKRPNPPGRINCPFQLCNVCGHSVEKHRKPPPNCAVARPRGGAPIVAIRSPSPPSFADLPLFIPPGRWYCANCGAFGHRHPECPLSDNSTDSVRVPTGKPSPSSPSGLHASSRDILVGLTIPTDDMLLPLSPVKKRSRSTSSSKEIITQEEPISLE